jgi:hypothetical protein
VKLRSGKHCGEAASAGARADLPVP